MAPIQKDEFLPLLRKANIVAHKKVERRDSCSIFYFLIDFDEQNNSFVRLVDSNLKTVNPDYRQFTGDLFHVLRTFYSIFEDSTESLSWNSRDRSVVLHRNPALVLQLLHCNNLITKDKQPIKISEDPAEVRLVLTQIGDTVTSSFVLQSGSERYTAFKFISDIFVLAGDTIYPIEPIGSNYSKLDFFLSTFKKAQLETYLSVFYSYIDNVQPDYEDYRLEISDDVIKTVPTIIFEKVDSDLALYLRLAGLLPNDVTDNIEAFDLVYTASLTIDHKIRLQRISYTDMAANEKELNKFILSFAPNKQAQKEIYHDNDFFIIPEETAGPFLLQGLPSIIEKYRLLGTENIKEYKVKPVAPKLKLALSSGIDFLEGDAEIELGDETFSLKKFLEQYKKNRYIVLSDGDRAIVDEKYIRKLERIFKNGKGQKNVEISFFDLPEIEELLNVPADGEAFLRHRKVYDGFNHLNDNEMQFPRLNADLREYQKNGVKWINYLYENKLGGCLADDMGLGKTLQTIAMLAKIYPKTTVPSLIVMPKSLLFNWQNEIDKFASWLKTYTYYGNNRDMEEAMKAQIIFTTYALVRNDIKEFMKQSFHYVILDESQNIKNVSAQVTRSVLLLRAEHKLALSGTPIENNLTELYSLFRFLNPAMFGTLEDFNTQYTYPIQKGDDKDTLQSLRKKIFPFLLRRLKKDVLSELPERIEQTVYVEMEEKHAEFYENRRQYYYDRVHQSISADGIQKSQFVMFQALNELRRIASVPESLSDGEICSPKLGILLDSLVEAVENGHKVVVFFNYIAGIELVSEKLDEAGIDFSCMTGSTRDRKSIVERFQNDPRCMVLLMTLKTGGVGLNLTAADTVFIFEPWWNKAAEEQAVNRLHRFGQKANVLSYSIITRNTIEEKIQILQQQKTELFNGLISNDSSSVKQLTEEDINFILA
ncbi:MAG: DEAD/DEAH box helicase [Candidatus Cryptobacteroides sp.]